MGCCLSKESSKVKPGHNQDQPNASSGKGLKKDPSPSSHRQPLGKNVSSHKELDQSVNQGLLPPQKLKKTELEGNNTLEKSKENKLVKSMAGGSKSSKEGSLKAGASIFDQKAKNEGNEISRAQNGVDEFRKTDKTGKGVISNNSRFNSSSPMVNPSMPDKQASRIVKKEPTSERDLVMSNKHKLNPRSNKVTENDQEGNMETSSQLAQENTFLRQENEQLRLQIEELMKLKHGVSVEEKISIKNSIKSQSHIHRNASRRGSRTASISRMQSTNKSGVTTGQVCFEEDGGVLGVNNGINGRGKGKGGANFDGKGLSAPMFGTNERETRESKEYSDFASGPQNRQNGVGMSGVRGVEVLEGARKPKRPPQRKPAIQVVEGTFDESEGQNEHNSHQNAVNGADNIADSSEKTLKKSTHKSSRKVQKTSIQGARGSVYLNKNIINNPQSFFNPSASTSPNHPQKASNQSSARLEDSLDFKKHPHLTPKTEKIEFIYEKVGGQKNWQRYLKRPALFINNSEKKTEVQKSPDAKKSIFEVIFKNGTKYKGTLKNQQQIHGKGKLTFPDGSTYEGEFDEGFMHGSGIRTFPDGSSYTGEFYRDFMHGNGVYTVPETAIDPENDDPSIPYIKNYAGNFAADTRSGRGRMLLSDGTNYEGEFLLNKMHGKGRLICSDCDYKGGMSQGLFHGHGVLKTGKNLQYKYVGQFQDGVKHGQGKFYLPDDKVYSTTWTQGLKNGRFFLETPQSVSEGIFEDDVIVGEITTKFKNGDVYVGGCYNFYREGKGRMVWVSHDTLKAYEGDFSKNMMHGQGTLELKNGTIYKGRMAKNKMSGFGVLETKHFVAQGEFRESRPSGTFSVHFKTGAKYLGRFDNFQRNGFGKICYTFYIEERADLNRSEISIAGRFLRDEEEEEVIVTEVEQVYEGYWKNGKKHGKGKMVIGDTTYEGIWVDGKKDAWFDVVKKLGRFKKERIRVLYRNGKVIKQKEGEK